MAAGVPRPPRTRHAPGGALADQFLVAGREASGQGRPDGAVVGGDVLDQALPAAQRDALVEVAGRGRGELSAGQTGRDGVGGLPGGGDSRGAGHPQRLAAGALHHRRVADGVHLRVGDGAHGAVDHDLPGAGGLQGGGLRDRVDGEAGGPQGDRGREGAAAVGGDVAGRDGGDGRPLVHGDAEPVEDLPQVPAAPGGEPVAEVAAGDQGDVEVRAGLGDLRRGLQAGESAAHHDHGLAGGQAGQALAQPEGAGAARDLVGVLGGAGDAVGVPAAAEGVHEGVVGQFAGRPGGVGDGDGPAVGVHAGHRRLPQFHSGAGENLAERAGPELLADRELVHPDALDEVGLGVDEGEGDVFAAQSPGQAAGGDSSGVTGPEDDDAVLHFLLLSSAFRRVRPLNRAARRSLTAAECDVRHSLLRRRGAGAPRGRCPPSGGSRVPACRG